MTYFNSFWHIISTMFWVFAFCAYLITLFSIISDLVRDRRLSGWAKAIWVLCLFFVPFLTALAYLLFRGRGMADRGVRQAKEDQQRAEDYIREVAGTSPADEIAKLQSLLESGVISQEEFQQLKSSVLTADRQHSAV